MSATEVQEDKKKWGMKYFDIAEESVRKWISKYLDEDPECLFTHYRGNDDILSFVLNDISYSFYLDNDEANDTKDEEKYMSPHFQVTAKEFAKEDNLKKSASIFFDAVRAVYLPIVKTMITLSHEMEFLLPDFVEESMLFRFKMVNRYLVEKQQALAPLDGIKTHLQSIKDRKSEKFDKIRKELITLQHKQIALYKSISDKDVDDENIRCAEINKKLSKGPFLHMCVVKNKKPSDNQVAKRLPKFGSKYEDPDEESLVDKLRKM